MNDGGVYNFAEIWSGFQMNVVATSSYGLGLDPMVMDQRSNHSSPNHNSRKRRDEDECAKGGASTNNSNGNINNNAMRRVSIPAGSESEGGNAEQMRSHGGLAVERLGRSVLKAGKLPDDLLILSCEEDYDVCVPFLEKGGAVYSSELLLNGIVKQKLEYERHRLFDDHVKKSRSTIWMKKKNRYLPVTKCQ